MDLHRANGEPPDPARSDRDGRRATSISIAGRAGPADHRPLLRAQVCAQSALFLPTVVRIDAELRIRFSAPKGIPASFAPVLATGSRPAITPRRIFCRAQWLTDHNRVCAGAEESCTTARETVKCTGSATFAPFTGSDRHEHIAVRLLPSNCVPYSIVSTQSSTGCGVRSATA